MDKYTKEWLAEKDKKELKRYKSAYKILWSYAELELTDRDYVKLKKLGFLGGDGKHKKDKTANAVRKYNKMKESADTLRFGL